MFQEFSIEIDKLVVSDKLFKSVFASSTFFLDSSSVLAANTSISAWILCLVVSACDLIFSAWFFFSVSESETLFFNSFREFLMLSTSFLSCSILLSMKFYQNN